MSENEIIEGNRLIANFLGFEYNSQKTYLNQKYHSSWDWLIPVVAKCSSHSENINLGFEFSLCYFVSNDIYGIYTEVVKFLKMCNAGSFS